jgi:hypothetical protein
LVAIQENLDVFEVIRKGEMVIGADVACLSEMNTDWGLISVLNDLHSKLRTHSAQHRLTKSQIPITFGSPYQQGAIIAFEVGGICSRINQENNVKP